MTIHRYWYTTELATRKASDVLSYRESMHTRWRCVQVDVQGLQQDLTHKVCGSGPLVPPMHEAW